MFKRIEPIAENNSDLDHPEHQTTNTRVSEYMRKYGQGKIDVMPTDPRPEVSDPRDVDDMLNGDDFEPALGTDELDVMMQLDQMRDKYNAAVADIQATEKQKSQFDEAIKVIKDSNSSYEQVSHAYAILEELERKGKISRART